ncbi:MAG TPA: acyclic terpene utilization AtuA family protein, partial [Kofleriaceae bacterium]
MRIGCGSGFWGDSALGAAQLVERGDIDVLVLDYLAEITMSILARMRARRPDAGYATDFVDAVIAPLAPQLAARRIKVVANAGGVNLVACKARVAQVLAERGVALEIATVIGDDILSSLDELRAAGALDLETGRPLPAHALSANAYLGAFPIAEALGRGADIVITGRCVDSALVVGPLIAAYGWTPGDLDRLAQGSLAGHVIECGAQATGGLATDWRRIERGYADMGFPIVECEPDGSFTVTKPSGTGGLVAPETVGEQITYEVHDPARYVLPDVVCDFTDVRLAEVGPDRVRVTGARGLPPPADYKASITYADGYRLQATLLIVGHDARAKAERVGAAILERVERINQERGLGRFRATSIEALGAERYLGAASRAQGTREVVLAIGAAHDHEAALATLAREIAPAATSMVQSITGFAGGRPSVQPVVRLASCLVPRWLIVPVVELRGATV